MEKVANKQNRRFVQLRIPVPLATELEKAAAHHNRKLPSEILHRLAGNTHVPPPEERDTLQYALETLVCVRECWETGVSWNPATRAIIDAAIKRLKIAL